MVPVSTISRRDNKYKHTHFFYDLLPAHSHNIILTTEQRYTHNYKHKRNSFLCISIDRARRRTLPLVAV